MICSTHDGAKTSEKIASVNLINNNPALAIATLLAVVLLAVFVWLYATDRKPVSAQST